MCSKHVTIEVDPEHEAKAVAELQSSHHHTPEELKREQKEAYPGEDIVHGDAFVVKADAAFRDAHQRGKKPRFDGFSMRHWNEHCKQKLQKNIAAGIVDLGTRSSDTDGPSSAIMKLPWMTEEEVRRHDEPDDLWMVVRGIVYDCTTWQRFHPGGESILRACGGRDATEVYDFYHKWVDCAGLMGVYAVGRIQPKEGQPCEE